MIALGLLIWIFYLGAVFLSWVALRGTNIRMLTFMDGLLVGCIYYIVTPMFFILLHGEIYPDFIETASYLPYEDLHTTIVLLIGMYLIPILTMLTRARPVGMDTTDFRILPATLILFAASTIYTTVSSGILSGGGHWYHAGSEAMQNDASFLLVKHLANFTRTAAFAVLFYSTTRGWITRRQAALYGLAVTIADMGMTFNRITAVYYLLMLVLVYRHRGKLLITLAAVGLPALTFISGIFPMFRGMLAITGTSPAGLADAAETAIANYDTSVPFVSSMNGIFESTNIVVLNFIVKEYGVQTPLLMGDLLIRPLTFFLPKMIWANRPGNFGTILGNILNNSDDLALNSTMFGEPYANFGDAWFVALAFLLLGYHYTFRLVAGRYRAAGAIAAFIAFAMWRFDTVFGIICLVLVGLLSLGLRITARVSNRQNAQTVSRAPRRAA